MQGGMPLPAVQKFLGQPSLESTGEFLAYTEADIKAMTRHYMHRETKLKTSARNRFEGVIASVAVSEIAAEVVADLADGTKVLALVTRESVDRLKLEVGREILVMFKAFSVILNAE